MLGASDAQQKFATTWLTSRDMKKSEKYLVSQPKASLNNHLNVSKVYYYNNGNYLYESFYPEEYRRNYFEFSNNNKGQTGQTPRLYTIGIDPK